MIRTRLKSIRQSLRGWFSLILGSGSRLLKGSVSRRGSASTASSSRDGVPSGSGSFRVLAVTAHRPRELREPLRRTDSPTAVVDIDSSNGFLRRNVAAVRQTSRAIRESEPDVVVYDCRELLGALVTLVCALAGVPTVFRFKGNHWRGLAETYRPERGDGPLELLRYRTSRLLDEWIYERAVGYLVVSEELKQVVSLRTGCDPDRIRVVHVPVETDRTTESAAQPRDRFGIEADEVVLTVTNLTYRGKYEGVETSVRGMAAVLRERPNAAYVVAGGGPYREDLRSFVDGHVDDPSVRERIHVPGFVDEVDDLYALADAFLYVSHIDGYPNAVLEAQQSGLPVVTNAAFGMVEQVTDGETGRLLADPGPADVAVAVESLLGDPEARERLGTNARDTVTTENDPERIGRETVDALSGILRAADE